MTKLDGLCASDFRGFRVAIVISYLQGSCRNIAEVEAARRFIFAASRLGISARIFKRQDDVYRFNPDLILLHTYQDAKLTDFRTFGTLTAPQAWMSSVDRFTDNISTYDGFICVSSNLDDYVEAINQSRVDRLDARFCAFTVPATIYSKPCLSPQSQACYVGTNWDKERHGWIFKDLASRGLLRCFGPRSSWNYLERSAFGGPLPFDGTSVLRCYSKMGIGLGLNHPDFDREGVPSSRTFEIPASGAVMISAENDFSRTHFGDSFYYVDTKKGEPATCDQLSETISLIRANPTRAIEMSHAAHEIFVKKFSLERMIVNLLSGLNTPNAADSCGRQKVEMATDLERPTLRALFLIRVGLEIFRLPRLLKTFKSRGVRDDQVFFSCRSRSGRLLLIFVLEVLKYLYKVDFTISNVEYYRDEKFHQKWSSFTCRGFSFVYTEIDCFGQIFVDSFFRVLGHAISCSPTRGLIFASRIVERRLFRNIPELGNDNHKIKRYESRRLAHKHECLSDIAASSQNFRIGHVPMGIFIGSDLLFNIKQKALGSLVEEDVKFLSDVVGTREFWV